MSQHEQMRRELLIDQAIRKQLDAVVSQANKTASELDPTKSSSRAKMEENQFRNVLNVAMETHSIEVVVNFIRYQIARPGSAWGNNDFGHKVIFDLSGIPRESSQPVVPCIIGERTKEALKWARDEIDRTAQEQIALLEQSAPQDATKRADIEQQCVDDKQAINAMSNDVAVRLMQLYLGYLGRAFYYATKTHSKENNSFELLRKVVANV